MSSLFFSKLRDDSTLQPKRWLWVAHDQLHPQLNPWAGESPVRVRGACHPAFARPARQGHVGCAVVRSSGVVAAGQCRCAGRRVAGRAGETRWPGAAARLGASPGGAAALPSHGVPVGLHGGGAACGYAHAGHSPVSTGRWRGRVGFFGALFSLFFANHVSGN